MKHVGAGGYKLDWLGAAGGSVAVLLVHNLALEDLLEMDFALSFDHTGVIQRACLLSKADIHFFKIALTLMLVDLRVFFDYEVIPETLVCNRGLIPILQ